MDSSAAATGPSVVLGVAVLALLVLAAVALVVLRRIRASAVPPEDPRPSGSPSTRDDLAVFSAHPPGSPGGIDLAPPGPPVPLFLPPAADPLPAVATGATAARVPADTGGAVARFLLAMTAVALLLVAGAAAAALVSSRAGATTRDAETSARMAFGSLLLVRQAVGVTVTYPAVSLSTRGDRAHVHLRLPTYDCLTDEVPADPSDAGCVPSVTEYGDLRTPALRMSHDGSRLVFSGRVSTYTHPHGTAAVSSGHVYDLTLAVTPGRRIAGGAVVAHGALTLGSDTARTDDDPAVDVLQPGG